MLKEIKYGKPPIVEVVCEFRFVPGEPWDGTIPGLVYGKLQDAFPKRRTLRSVQSEVGPAEGGVVQQVQLVERVQLLRDDEKAFVQVGPDFLAINHLAPYPTWEGFRPLIVQAFQAYRDVSRPAGLQRIGLRYINRILFPTLPIEFKDFSRFYPFSGPDLPQTVHSFVVGIQSPFEDERDGLRLQMSSTDPDEAKRLSALLDLDYFLARPQAVGLDECLDWVGRAHDHVLETFEACLTDRLRGMFEPIEG